jgi:hypothetical protein
MTGESARTAASRPETTAAVASLCASYWSIVIGPCPAVSHAWERAVMSSTCTVPRCTAMDSPQAFSGSTPSGLPARVAHWVPASK